MPKKPAKPPSDADSERLYRDHLLPRYVRVVGGFRDAIEISARPGHRISFVETVENGKPVVHIVVAPIAKAA
jgi:hypothetical protein